MYVCVSPGSYPHNDAGVQELLRWAVAVKAAILFRSPTLIGPQRL